MFVSEKDLNLLRNNTYEDVTDFISKRERAQGASWNGAVTAGLIAGGVVLTAFVAYTWFIHNQLECDGFYDCHGGE